MDSSNRFEQHDVVPASQSTHNRLKTGLVLAFAIATSAAVYVVDEDVFHNHTNPENSRKLHESGDIPTGELQKVFNVASRRLLSTSETLTPGVFPYATNSEGEWTLKEGPQGWVSGFFPGSLWLMYEQTGKEVWKQRAEAWTKPINSQTTGEHDHEIGLVLIPSYGTGYEATKSNTYKDDLLGSASVLAKRYNQKVGALGSVENGPSGQGFRIIMDNIMSLELLFWASENGGDPLYKTIAIQHALTAMKSLVRTDGSIYQDAMFNPQTGALESQFNAQGYSATSDWARGQAWAIAGFSTAYKLTNNPSFLHTAEKVADYFINNLPTDNIPYWDFQAPNIPNAPRDSSAAAIASSYLLELSTLEPDQEKQLIYFNSAQNILKSLISSKYLAPKGEALLSHATQNMHLNSYNTGLVYGDYYYLQALERYEQITSKGNTHMANKRIDLAG